jgi:RNA polymerase sigma-70 factor (ECF subfamily)
MSKLRSNRSARAADKERDRVRAAQSAVDDDLQPAEQPIDWSHMPDEELLRRQLRQAVVAAISELPEIYRAPVVLRDIQGLSTEEASSRLNVKDQTLKSRLHRGRLMLRQRLQPFTSGLSLHQRPVDYSYRAAA